MPISRRMDKEAVVHVHHEYYSAIKKSLDFLNALICILGSTVQLLLQEAQLHIGLTELFPLDFR